jgi:sRNA-binding protein
MSKEGRVAAAAHAKATISLLADRYPKAFAVQNQRRPLKLGIHADIAAAIGGGLTPKELRRALRWYTGSLGYLRGMLPGAARLDLHGQPSGVVTATEAQHAQEMLAQLLACGERPASPSAKPPTAPSTEAGRNALASPICALPAAAGESWHKSIEPLRWGTSISAKRLDSLAEAIVALAELRDG